MHLKREYMHVSALVKAMVGAELFPLRQRLQSGAGVTEKLESAA
jgi:hypothetical protein